MKKVPKDGLRVVEPAEAERQLALPLREVASVVREGLLALSGVF